MTTGKPEQNRELGHIQVSVYQGMLDRLFPFGRPDIAITGNGKVLASAYTHEKTPPFGSCYTCHKGQARGKLSVYNLPRQEIGVMVFDECFSGEFSAFQQAMIRAAAEMIHASQCERQHSSRPPKAQ